MKTGIVVNPRAGRGRALELASRAERELREAGLQCELLRTQGSGAATTLARDLARAGCELVFAAGGDGTINEVVQGLAGTGTTFGVIPAGLANVWAADVGLSTQVGAFTDLVQTGLVFDTDLGRLNDRHFLVMAGIGFDAAVVADVTADGKARWAQLAYAYSAATTAFRWQAPTVSVTVDGQPLGIDRLFGAIVTNANRYAGLFDLSPTSRLDDGVMDVLVYRDGGFPRRVRSMLLADHRVRRWDGWVTVRSAERLTISSSAPLPLHTDAELAGWTPCDVQVAPRALPVLLPAASARRFCATGRPLRSAALR